jgi:N-glycosidase YbiA
MLVGELYGISGVIPLILQNKFLLMKVYGMKKNIGLFLYVCGLSILFQSLSAALPPARSDELGAAPVVAYVDQQSGTLSWFALTPAGPVDVIPVVCSLPPMPILYGPIWYETSYLNSHGYFNLCDLAIDSVRFDNSTDYWGHFFCNDSAHPIEIDGASFATVEHYFQAQKVLSDIYSKDLPDYVRLVHTKKLEKVREIARNYGKNKYWQTEKFNVLYKALMAKCKQHDDVRAALQATGNAPILYNSAVNTEWGIGKNGWGRNLIGIVWMRVRQDLFRK